MLVEQKKKPRLRLLLSSKLSDWSAPPDNTPAPTTAPTAAPAPAVDESLRGVQRRAARGTRWMLQGWGR